MSTIRSLLGDWGYRAWGGEGVVAGFGLSWRGV